jgi:hypothetical protein
MPTNALVVAYLVLTPVFARTDSPLSLPKIRLNLVCFCYEIRTARNCKRRGHEVASLRSDELTRRALFQFGTASPPRRGCLLLVLGSIAFVAGQLSGNSSFFQRIEYY